MAMDKNNQLTREKYIQQCISMLTKKDYKNSYLKLNVVETVFGYDDFTSRIKSSLMRESFLNLNAEDFDKMFPVRGEPRVCILGDSHVRSLFLDYNIFQRNFNLEPTILAISGASISGLRRDTSTLGLKNKISSYVGYANPSVVVFKFGQVDIDLGYYYRRIVKNIDLNFNDFIEDLSKQYISQVSYYAKKYKCLVCGINLPSIFKKPYATTVVGNAITESIDDAEMKSVCIERLSVEIPSIHERTRMSLAFNGLISSECAKRKICYIDFNDYFLDKNSMLLKHEFSQNNDVHCATTFRDKQHCIDILMKYVFECGN